MKYKVLNSNSLDDYINIKTSVLINDLNSLEKVDPTNILKLKDSFNFNNNSLLIFVFFDGSLPKREIKEINLVNNNLEIKTNINELSFSTMDYRKHTFIIKLEKVYNINNIILKK